MNDDSAFCFDLDGTVTRDEILPIIAKEAGIHEEISALTTATIRGVIPFKESFLLRCKLLSSIPVEKIHEIINEVRFYDEIVKFISKNKSNCFIITGNLNLWIAPLVDRLGCQYFSSKGSFKKNYLSVDKVLNKADAINEIKKEFNNIISIGDGMGDVQMFENSNVNIAYGATHEPVASLLKLSNYVIYDEKALCRLLSTL
tara:strand:- start:31956 stop:32558 length:603 start_codon:yes stop_codon:yes gene_type:complete